MRTTQRYIYYGVIVLIVVLIFGLYFYTFHGSISDDSYVWSNFGNYINGLLTPLLTIINIAVFIEITIAISQSDELRSKKALEHERELLLMQLRKQEIDTFIQQMNKLNNYSTRKELIEHVDQVSYYLQAFEQTGLKYFKFEEGIFADRQVKNLWLSLQKYKANLEEDKDFDVELFNEMYDSKAKLISILVDSALKQ